MFFFLYVNNLYICTGNGQFQIYKTKMEIKLTKNFTLDEMCRSNAARKLQIKNVPYPNDIARLKLLCENVLQPLRDYMGAPVLINSGYRSPELNIRIGGVRSSQHVKGEAADIRCENRTYADDVVNFIFMNLDFDQLILERKKGTYWVHVSYTGEHKNRHHYLEILK